MNEQIMDKSDSDSSDSDDDEDSLCKKRVLFAFQIASYEEGPRVNLGSFLKRCMPHRLGFSTFRIACVYGQHTIVAAFLADTKFVITKEQAQDIIALLGRSYVQYFDPEDEKNAKRANRMVECINIILEEERWKRHFTQTERDQWIIDLRNRSEVRRHLEVDMTSHQQESNIKPTCDKKHSREAKEDATQPEASSQKSKDGTSENKKQKINPSPLPSASTSTAEKQ